MFLCFPSAPMFPHIVEVNQIIKKIQEEKINEITITGVSCAELAIVLQKARTPQSREILTQMFKSKLTDRRFQDAVSFLTFASEKEKLLNILNSE